MARTLMSACTAARTSGTVLIPEVTEGATISVQTTLTLSLTNNVSSQGSQQLDLSSRLKVWPANIGVDTSVDILLQIPGNTLAHLSHLPAVASNNWEKSRAESK